MAVIIPTVLTDNENEYHRRLLMAEHVADLVQIDVIDGKFANNLTIGPNVIKKYPSSSMLEIQLMVTYPRIYIDELIRQEYIGRIIVPFEAEDNIREAIYNIKSHHKQAGISLNPQTPIHSVLSLMDDIDLLLLLAVDPGFSGQKFQEHVLDKIRGSKKLAPMLAVEVDGGINFENAQKIANSGADFLAVNSALYKAVDFKIAFEKLAKIVESTQN